MSVFENNLINLLGEIKSRPNLLLWLYGDPRTGKTLLAELLCKILFDNYLHIVDPSMNEHFSIESLRQTMKMVPAIIDDFADTQLNIGKLKSLLNRSYTVFPRKNRQAERLYVPLVIVTSNYLPNRTLLQDKGIASRLMCFLLKDPVKITNDEINSLLQRHSNCHKITYDKPIDILDWKKDNSDETPTKRRKRILTDITLELPKDIDERYK